MDVLSHQPAPAAPPPLTEYPRTAGSLLPLGLSLAALRTAKGQQLKLWATATNERIALLGDGKKRGKGGSPEGYIRKSVKVEDLRTALARHYEWDLSVSGSVATTAPPTLDQDILDRGWDSFVELGKEWTAAGKDFRLVRDNTATNYTNPMLAIEGDTQDASRNTSPLATPFAAMPPRPLPAAPTRESSSSPPVAPQPMSSDPLACSASAPPALVNTLANNILELPRCDDLPACIAQMEREPSIVQQIEDAYGPKQGRQAKPEWQHFANPISKRKRVFRVLTEDFGGDKQRFFGFFTNELKRKRAVGNESAGEPPVSYRAFRLVSEAVSWCKRDVGLERQLEEYRDELGGFSEEQWRKKWVGKNDWEIWRALGKERYINKVPKST